MSEKYGDLLGSPNDERYLNAFGITEADIEAVAEVIRSKRLGGSGNSIRALEEVFTSYIGVKYAVASSSGTAALTLAMAAIGIGPGDEVIVPACSSLATPNSVLYRNGVPVFGDVDQRTLCLDVKDAESKITDRTKAIVAVHMYGCPCDMEPLVQLAAKHDLYLVEDCCLAMGGEYDGQKLGSWGDVACFSFGAKQLNLGQAGMVVSNNDTIGKEMAKRNHHYGLTRIQSAIGQSDCLGYNLKLTELQGALGVVQMKRLDGLNDKRIQNAAFLTQNLQPVRCIDTLNVPDKGKHVFSSYIIRLRDEVTVTRQWFLNEMCKHGVFGDPLFDKPMYLEESYREQKGYGQGCPFKCPVYLARGGHSEYHEGLCPVAERVLPRIISLPVHPGLSTEDLNTIVTAVSEASRKSEEYY